MPRRYLFVRLTALGDIVFALEALASLRRAEPEAQVDWVVEDRWAGLLQAQADLGRHIIYPRKALQRALLRPWLWPGMLWQFGRHVRTLRAERYDAVLELQGNLKGGLHALLARADRKIGFAAPRAKELSWLCVRERVELPRPRPHREAEGRALVRQLLGEENAPSETPLLPESATAGQEARAWLEAQFGQIPESLVILAPGTSAFAAFKRWPAERYAQLAQQLLSEGHAVVVSAGPGERELALASGAEPEQPSGARLFDGAEHGLPTFLELLRRARVLVAADSAPLHLAQAVGTPCVALFGPKDPELYGPWRGHSEILRHPVPCAPCGLRSCPLPLCVRGVPAQQVAAAVQRVLRAACSSAKEPRA
jgi:heptosyltransferase-1